MSDELIEVRNCAESYLDNAKYHLLHGGYEKALSFANMARDEINYIINHASQQSVQSDLLLPCGHQAVSSYLYMLGVCLVCNPEASR